MADLKISANVDVRIQAPWDERITKRTKADLINPDSWSKDGSTLYVYRNMLVATDEGLFQLLDVDKALAADYSGWKQIDVSNLTPEEVVEMISGTLEGYVKKEGGKGLSSNDYTNEDKQKLAGLSNYDDTALSTQVSNLQNALNTLVSGNVTQAIESFNEVVAFLANITDSTTLEGIIAAINQSVSAVNEKAQTAVDTAETAKNLATSANESASTAVNTATSANTKAEEAVRQAMVAIESIRSLQGLSDADQAMVELAKQIAAIEKNKSDIAAINASTVYLTQEEYDALVADGQIKADVEYNIYEDE